MDFQAMACLVSRLVLFRESSLVPAGFLKAQSFFFVAKTEDLWSLCCDEVIMVGLLCIDCMEERESLYKSILHPSKLLYIFPFPQEKNAEKPHPRSLSQQRVHKSQFLQKLSCQKLCWDQTWLSSLINKQFVPMKKCSPGQTPSPV